jgi:hypothetical protein
MPTYQDSWELKLALNLATCNSKTIFTTSHDLVDANGAIKVDAKEIHVSLKMDISERSQETKTKRI